MRGASLASSALLLLGLLQTGCAAEPAAALGAPSRAKEVAATPRGRSPVRLRVAVVSDLNGRYGSAHYGDAVHAAVDRLLDVSPDLVLSTGDMVAGQRAGLDYPGMWRSFHGAVSDRLAGAGVPFAVTPGNHDGSAYDAFAPERAQYIEEWTARRPDVEMVDASDYPLRYSFRRGPALFVSLDSTGIGPLSDEQMRWLDRQLASSDDAVKIVFGHVPLYPFAHGRERETIGDPHLEGLLRRHDVDLFVSGHHHAFYPGRRGPLRLVSMACLGGGPRPLIGTNHPSERSVVVFDVTERGIEQLDGWGGPEFDEVVRRSDLPRSVGDGATRIDRDDINVPDRPVDLLSLR